MRHDPGNKYEGEMNENLVEPDWHTVRYMSLCYPHKERRMNCMIMVTCIKKPGNKEVHMNVSTLWCSTISHCRYMHAVL